MPVNRIQLQDALQKPYDRVLFSREVLRPVFGSSFTLNSSLVPTTVLLNKSESAAIDKVWIYGKIQLDDSTEVTCYEVLLQPTVRIEQSKVAIQQYVRKLLTAGQAALINFVPGRDSSPSGEMSPGQRGVWRLTLVAKDSVLTDKGVKEKTTNAKRYTFLLGPSETCKTAAERFEVLSTEKEITFQTLVNAFSVEKLSKAFFEEYTLHYQNFCDYLQESNYRKSVFNISFPTNATKQEKDKASKSIRDFVKKLLGRIVFLYFVQKKAWLGASDTNYVDGLGDFIKQLFNKSGGNDAFYSNWLTILFFDTLNKERANDDFKMPDGKTVKVPFLNGGLFDKEEFDEHMLTFPSKLFHHPDFEDAILTAKNNGFARGFLDFLDAFNFTIYEDSPDDHTVAVDPEILGHIFENLLEDNKDKGAFYTPKEIVHYMCQESLTEYCLNLDFFDCGISVIDEDKRMLIESIIKKKEVDFELLKKYCKSEEFCKSWFRHLEKHLDNVKICDPAIGSGAFPVGLLQEIISIKELIAYETNNAWKPAETKLNIIQNSIYGVDIEKGAVDIARLRFWLSLVVDDEKPKALPNLDYKIVVGDSLISKFDDEIVEIDWGRKQSVGKADEYVKNVQRLLVEVAEKQKEYFNPNNKNKKKLQTIIRNLKIELLKNQISFNKELYVNRTAQKGGFTPTAADIKHNTKRELQIAAYNNLISKLNNLLKTPTELFKHFDWKLDFPEVLNEQINSNPGFDIVIANPPYIDSETMVNTGNEDLRVFLSNKLSFCKGNWDIYIAFFDFSYGLLNNTGNLIFITPDKWISKPFGDKIRKGLISNFVSIAEAGRKVFENAKVDSIITFITKTPKSHIKINKFVNGEAINFSSVDKTSLVKPYALDWLFSDFVSKLNQIDKFPNKLSDYAFCENACATSDAYKIKNYLLDTSFDSDKHLKIINTGTIGRYVSKWGKKEMTYLKDKYLEPVVSKKKFQKDFSNSYGAKSILPKLIIKGLTLLDGCIDAEGVIIPGKSTLVITKPEGKENELLFPLALINSKISLFYIKEKYRGSSYNQGINFNPDMLNNLPIPAIDKSTMQLIISLVKKIVNESEKEHDTLSLEQNLDNIFYKLYELSYEEVKVIDPEFSLSKNEYESIKIE